MASQTMWTEPVRNSNKIVAVIFDWAGTTVDCGSLAPVIAIKRIFAERGIQLTSAQIRQDMGLHKRDHIRALLGNPEVRQLWEEACGRPSSDADIETLFGEMLAVQLAVLPEHSGVLAGVPGTVEALRKRGIKIGSTTGYTPKMMAPLLAAAAKQGYAPDCLVCPEDVGGGRPFPWMIYSACLQLQAYPLWRCVKVGDTVSDMEEGRNAGTWTIGVTRTGNLVGMDEREWAAQNAAEQRALLGRATDQLRAAGADFVVDSVSDLMPAIDAIEQQLTEYARPTFKHHDLPA